MKIIVIGGGPAGMTAAYQLSKVAKGVCLLEQSEMIGGLSRSFQLWEQRVDVGPHRFFSHDRRVNELWLEVVNKDYEMVDRQTRILYQGQLFNYPLEASDVIGKLGTYKSVSCLASYAKELLVRTREDGSFENWVRRRFGKRLFELFFKTYSEKLWGIPSRELDADFAAQRIRKFSLFAAISNALTPSKKINHRTLADKFAYPTGGSGLVYERMAEAACSRGAELRLQSKVKRVVVENGRIAGVELRSGERIAGDHVISTMPLPNLVKSFDGVPARVSDACRQLRFRNTVIVYLEILNENPFPDNWIYVHNADLMVGRITNFRNWVPQICKQSKHTIVSMEYWCNSEEPFWRRDDFEFVDQARAEILRSGLVKRYEMLGRSFVLRVPKSYPVYRRGYREHLKCIRQYLNAIEGLQVIGRYGAFKYNNQDHSILMGRMAAENVLQNAHHDLWSVNTDYDTFQEACSIDKSGLVTSVHANLK